VKVKIEGRLCPWSAALEGGSTYKGLGFRVQGSGFRVQGSGFRVQGSGFRVQGVHLATPSSTTLSAKVMQSTLGPSVVNIGGCMCPCSSALEGGSCLFQLLSSLTLSDNKVYEPLIRALFGTVSHFFEGRSTWFRNSGFGLRESSKVPSHLSPFWGAKSRQSLKSFALKVSTNPRKVDQIGH